MEKLVKLRAAGLARQAEQLAKSAALARVKLARFRAARPLAQESALILEAQDALGAALAEWALAAVRLRAWEFADDPDRAARSRQLFDDGTSVAIAECVGGADRPRRPDSGERRRADD